MMSRSSLLVGFLVFECFIFAFLSIKVINAVKDSSIKTLQHEASVLADALSPAAVKAIISNNQNEFNDSVENIYRTAHVEYVQVVDALDNQIVSTTLDSGVKSNFSDLEFPRLTVHQTLFHEGKVIGGISLIVSSKLVRSSLSDIYRSLYLIGLLVICLNLLAVVFFRKLFSRDNSVGRFNDLAHQYSEAISDLKNETYAESKINSLEKLNHALINKSPEAIVLIDHNNNIMEFNSSSEILFAVDSHDVIGRSVDEVFRLSNYDEKDSLSEIVTKMQNAREERHLCVQIYDSLSTDVLMDVVTFDSFDRNKYAILYFKRSHAYVNEDLIKQYVAKLDDLTSLPCRDVLVEHLWGAIKYANEANRQVVVLKLGLDRFKNINDSLGHHMGNALLLNVASRLSSMLRRGDIVSRVSGDQFVIVLADVSELTNPDSLIKRHIDAFTEPFIVKSHSLHVNVSIGVTVYPTDDTDVEILLRNAESAMFRAKLTSGSSYEFYSNEMRIRSKERLFLENELRTALKYDQFELYYQPQVDLSSGKIIGVEALIRWNHPTLGQIPPIRFISLAEETGLIIPIGEWVIRRACEQNMELMKERGENLMLAINLSARQFTANNIVATVADVLNETQYPPEYLEMEITESLLMDNIDGVAKVLRIFSDQGIKISMDDFGTGYSSLSYLKKFPINTLKVDRTFVNDILNDSDNASIVSATIKMAHSLNIDIVAEGVETEEQLSFLYQHRCDKIQGYLFSKPLRIGELKIMLRENKMMHLPVMPRYSAARFQ